MRPWLDSERLRALRSRGLQALLFGISCLGFVAAVYAEAAWLQNLGAAVGIGFCISGCTGLWLRHAHGRGPRRPPETLYYKK